MEKLEREKWESESKAHKWKMDFQDLCQTYEVTGCNKATLYYMSALQLREQIQDNALKRLFIYAICDAGFLMDRYADCKEQQMEASFRNTEKRMRKLLTLLLKEKEMCEQWGEIVGRKRFSSKNRVYSDDYNEELLTLCSLFRETFEMSERQTPNLADNLQYFLMEARNNDLIEKIIPFYLFQVMVRHTNRLAQNPDFQIVPASLWKYKEYEITKNNGKNFNKYERCIGLFQKLCKLYKNDPRIDIALCRYGMEQCSNIPEWTSIWLRKKEKKCTTKLHRFISELYLSCIETDEPEQYAANTMFPHKTSEEENLFIRDVDQKLEIEATIKSYILEHIEVLIQFMKIQYKDVEQVKCLVTDVYHASGFSRMKIEDIGEETKLTYVYDQFIEMLDEAIVSSVWETIKKLVECESDHFQFMAAILS